MEKKEESQVVTREEIEKVLKALGKATDGTISEGSVPDPDKLNSHREEVERYIQSFEGMDRDAVALIVAASIPLLSGLSAMLISNLAKKAAMNKLVQSFLK